MSRRREVAELAAQHTALIGMVATFGAEHVRVRAVPDERTAHRPPAEPCSRGGSTAASGAELNQA